MLRTRTLRRLSALVAATALSTVGLVGAMPTEAGAIGVPTFSLTPVSAPGAIHPRGSFHYDMKPGQTIDDSVVLANDSSQLQDFQIWATDGLNTPIGGAFALRPLGYHMTGVGAWINTHLGTGIYGLAGNTSVTINFSVTVPANATPGDHAGGIEALDVTPEAQPTKGPAHFVIHRGVATAVFVRVAGPVHASAAVSDIAVKTSVPATGFGNSKATISFQLENTGNTLLSGEAVVTVTNLFGQTVKTFRPIGVQAFVPGGRFTANEPTWTNLPFIGPETVHVKFTSPGIPAATGSSTFWILPWLLVVVIIAALAALAALWWRRRRRRLGPGAPTGAAETGPEGASALEGRDVPSEASVGSGG